MAIKSQIRLEYIHQCDTDSPFPDLTNYLPAWVDQQTGLLDWQGNQDGRCTRCNEVLPDYASTEDLEALNSMRVQWEMAEQGTL